MSSLPGSRLADLLVVIAVLALAAAIFIVCLPVHPGVGGSMGRGEPPAGMNVPPPPPEPGSPPKPLPIAMSSHPGFEFVGPLALIAVLAFLAAIITSLIAKRRRAVDSVTSTPPSPDAQPPLPPEPEAQAPSSLVSSPPGADQEAGMEDND
jgi:hypothetical protein